MGDTVNLAALPGEFHFTVKVLRKETGLVEEYQMVGTSQIDNTEKDKECQ